MKQRLKINGVIIVTALAVLALFPAFFLGDEASSGIDAGFDFLGMTLIALGQLTRISARGHKAERSGQGDRLVQDGPYSLVRNPMYLGILLIELGLVVILFKWWVGVVFGGVFIFRYILLMRSEEKKLVVLFGEEYSRYMSRVPRLIPSLRGTSGQDISVYLPLKRRWVMREIGAVIAVIVPVFLIEAWKNGVHGAWKAYWMEASVMITGVLAYVFLAGYLIWRTRLGEQSVSTAGKDSGQ